MHLNNEIKEYAKDLIKFMRSKFNIDRVPKIHFINNKENASNILGKTGGYDPDDEEITIYIAERHPKDILRSLAHEMLHHIQKCEGMMEGEDLSDTQNPNYIMHNDYLKNLEADAFERGNICFREWEATKKGEKLMGESKKMSKPEIKAKHKKAEDAMSSFIKQYGKEKGKQIAYATAMGGGMDKKKVDEAAKPDYLDFDKDGNKKESMKSALKSKKKKKVNETAEDVVEEGIEEVKINDALKNSHYYVPSDRAAGDMYNKRDEQIYNDLLKKFGIKK